MILARMHRMANIFEILPNITALFFPQRFFLLNVTLGVRFRQSLLTYHPRQLSASSCFAEDDYVFPVEFTRESRRGSRR